MHSSIFSPFVFPVSLHFFFGWTTLLFDFLSLITICHKKKWRIRKRKTVVKEFCPTSGKKNVDIIFRTTWMHLAEENAATFDRKPINLEDCSTKGPVQQQLGHHFSYFRHRRDLLCLKVPKQSCRMKNHNEPLIRTRKNLTKSKDEGGGGQADDL